MSTNILFSPYAGFKASHGTKVTANNFPAGSDVMLLTRGERIMDEKGDITNLRGVLIQVTGAAQATTPLPNIPFVWEQGTYLNLASGTTIEFYGNAIVSYGVRVATV